MLQLGWLIRSCDGVDALFGFEDGAQQDRVVGGTQPVAQKIADRLGNAVKLGKPVRRIAVTNGGDATVYADGLVVHAKHVIVALPPNLAGAIEYEPSLPTARMQVTQRWPQGLVIKVSMLYSEPFWTKDGKSGTSFDYTAFMSETADSSNPEHISTAGILTGFVYADKAREILPKSKEEREARLLAEMVDRFGERAAKPVNYHETNWSMQQWTRGCFTGFLTPGATTLFKSAVRDHCGPIHWAGTETATEWPSFIEGAIRSGERAAKEIIDSA
jgi:monoamine oxidase